MGVTVLLLLAAGVCVSAQSNGSSAVNTTIGPPIPEKDCKYVKPCQKGMLPAWTPVDNLTAGDKAARGIVYLLALIYMFLGVSIIADRFMAAIEVITSQEKEVKVKRPFGEVQTFTVRVWNETVSNLTLMALGSSAPEIMLSIIEICSTGFEAGDLGPSTIVGSAAFNLFVIIGLCIIVIPNGENRTIKHIHVFFITATWSLFAYIWLYLILAVITPNEINVWEGLVTLAFFPLTVGSAYIADKQIFFGKFLGKKAYKAGGHAGIVIGGEGADMELGDKEGQVLEDSSPEAHEFERHRMEFISILKELRKKHPNMDTKELEALAEMEAMNRGPKSRAFYRIQATRKLTGAGNVLRKSKVEKKLQAARQEEIHALDPHTTRVSFDPGHYTVLENIGTFDVTIVREGGDHNRTVLVDYCTEDGTANAGSDYEAVEGTLTFNPGETHCKVSVNVIDDDVFEEDEHFYVKLKNARFADQGGNFLTVNGRASGDRTPADNIELATPSTATVMILDDDHAGVFGFELQALSVSEAIGHATVKVLRSSGARGQVRVPYYTADGSAKGNGDDYFDAEGEVVFDNDETEQEIKVRIVDDEEYEKSENFFLHLGEPILNKRDSGFDDPARIQRMKEKKKSMMEKIRAQSQDSEGDQAKAGDDMTEEAKIASLGKPKLGENIKCEIKIKESTEFKSTVDKLIKMANVSLVVSTSSWREQFVDAISVSPGGGQNDEGDEDDMEGEGPERHKKMPSCMDYVMHFLSLFWKVLFACVPPTDYWNGWACFVVSILFIGLLTAVIGDLAGFFGCTVGMKDTVTAISFVALGTSVPDTFASKVAAVGDPYADSSIGNVTGSNAVNVFLGIGLAWSIAAIYHLFKGTKFLVPAGDLGFSVTIFCIMAVLSFVIILVRRWTKLGELGGPTKAKYISASIFFLFWIIYLVLSSLQAYCYIPGF